MSCPMRLRGCVLYTYGSIRTPLTGPQDCVNHAGDDLTVPAKQLRPQEFELLLRPPANPGMSSIGWLGVFRDDRVSGIVRRRCASHLSPSRPKRTNASRKSGGIASIHLKRRTGGRSSPLSLASTRDSMLCSTVDCQCQSRR